MIQRGGEVIIRMLENVKRVTIDPIIDQFIATGSIVYTGHWTLKDLFYFSREKATRSLLQDLF